MRRFATGEEAYVAFPPFVVTASEEGAYRFSFEGGGDGYAALSFADCGDAQLGTSSSETSCFAGGPTVTGVVEAEWDLRADECYLVRWGSLRGSVDAVAVEWVGPFNQTRSLERLARASARAAGGDAGMDALAAGVAALSVTFVCVTVYALMRRRERTDSGQARLQVGGQATSSGRVG